MDKLLKRTLNEKIRTQRYPSRSYYSLMAEKERSVVAQQQTSLLLRGFWRKRDSPFSENGRVYSHSGACNGEFGGAAVSQNQVMIVRENLSSRRKRGQLLPCNKHLFCSAGFLPILVILRATRPCFLYSQ